MNNLKKAFLIVAATMTLTVTLQLIAGKIEDDLVKIGKPSAATSKVLEFDTNDGANNAKITVDDAGHDFSFDKSNNLTFGDGSAANQNFILNKGVGASNPKIRWNESLSKLQWADDGLTYTNLSDGLTAKDVPLKVGLFSDFSVLTHGTGGLSLRTSLSNTPSPSFPVKFILPRNGTSMAAIELKLTSDINFDNSGTPDWVGAYHTTAGLVWADGREFVLSACNKDNTDAGLFFIIADRNHLLTPASGNDIGYFETTPVNAGSSKQVFVMRAGIVPADFINKECIPVAHLTATKNASNVWTISDTTSPNYFPVNINNRMMQLVAGHNGSNASSFLWGAGAPDWATFSTSCGSSGLTYGLKIDSGEARYKFSTTTCGAPTNGLNGNPLQVHLPFKTSVNSTFYDAQVPIPCGGYRATGASPTSGTLYCIFLPGLHYVQLYVNTSGPTPLDNNDFSGATDDFWFEVNYLIDTAL